MKRNEPRSSSETQSLIKPAVSGAAPVIGEEMTASAGFYQWGIVLSERCTQSLYSSDKVPVFVTLRGKCPRCVESWNNWFDRLAQWPQPRIDYLADLLDTLPSPPDPSERLCVRLRTSVENPIRWLQQDTNDCMGGTAWPQRSIKCLQKKAQSKCNKNKWLRRVSERLQRHIQSLQRRRLWRHKITAHREKKAQHKDTDDDKRSYRATK